MMTSSYESGFLYDDFREEEHLERNDQYVHSTFTEYSDPQAVEQAWRTHATGYRLAGFVNESAITDEGFLSAELDGSRGPNTEYFMAVNPSNPSDVFTIRKDNLPEGGTYRDLPAYKLCADALSADGLAYLDGLADQETRVKEIGALAGSAQSNPLGAHELYRTLIHEAMGKDEVWFFTVVSSTYNSLAKGYGYKNFEPIGEDVQIPDERVNPELWLRPTIVRPDEFIDNILEAYLEAKDRYRHAVESGDPRAAKSALSEAARLQRSHVFFTDGVPEDQLSELSAGYKKLFKAEEDEKRQSNINRAASKIGSVALNETA